MVSTRRQVARWSILVAIPALVIATAAGAFAQGPPAPLRWEFKAGQTIRYEFRQKNEIKVKGEGNGQESTNTTNLTIDLGWKVNKVDFGGKADVTMRVSRARVVIVIGAKTLRYDSDDPKTKDDPLVAPLRDVYREAIGSDYALTVDPRGEVLAAKVPAALTEALQASPFLAVADGGSVFSETGVKHLFAQMSPVLPKTSLAHGDTWTTSADIPAPPLTIRLTSRNTLAARDEASARVEARIEAVIESDPGTPFTVKVKTQSGNGTFDYDLKAGKLSRSQVKQSLTLTLMLQQGEVEQTIAIEGGLKRVR